MESWGKTKYFTGLYTYSVNEGWWPMKYPKELKVTNLRNTFGKHSILFSNIICFDSIKELMCL